MSENVSFRLQEFWLKEIPLEWWVGETILAFITMKGQWIVEGCRQSKNNGKLQCLWGGRQFGICFWPWCSRHAEEFCNQRNVWIVWIRIFGLFLIQQTDQNSILGYLWVTLLTFSCTTKLWQSRELTGTMSCSIVLTTYFFAATGIFPCRGKTHCTLKCNT